MISMDTLPESVTKMGCPNCNWTGYFRYDVPVGHKEFGKIHPCECTKQVTLKQLAQHTRLTDNERTYTLGLLGTTGKPGTLRMVIAAKNFIADPSGFLTICGNTGNGKTTTLMSIVNHCTDNNMQAVYITFYDLVSYVRDAISSDTETEWQRVNKLANVRVLCIDEVDKVKETEWTQQIITHVLDVRYRNSLEGKAGTVVAFNGNLDKIPHKWIKSRLSEGLVIVNNDADIRPEIAKVKQETLFTHPATGETFTA